MQGSSQWKGKNILLWGMGVSGRATLDLLRKLGASVTIVDRNKIDFPETSYKEEELPFEKLSIDTVIKAPGVPWDHRAFDYFKKKNIPIIGEIELVSSLSSVPIIAVTGSNGKSTTVNMISHALTLMGVPHFLGGNWGIPYSEILTKAKYQKAHFAVLEVSSFQLELVENFSPKVAVLLNVFPNHQERYRSFEDYRSAKLKIANHANSFIEEKDIKDIELDFSSMKVLGEHNKKNFKFCYKVLEKLGLHKNFKETIDSFKGIPHRLEFVGKDHKGVSYYNDSKSTNIEATVTALKAFSSPAHLMIGGKLREKDLSSFVILKSFPAVKSIHAFGEAAPYLEKVLGSRSFEKMEEALDSFDIESGDSVLLSPGFPSYDQFKNFEERGGHFKDLIKERFS